METAVNQRNTYRIIDRVSRVNIDGGRTVNSPRTILMMTVAQDHPQLARQELENTAKEVALATRNQEVLSGGKVRYESLAALADAVERNNSATYVADRLERANNETNAQEEYYRWLDEGAWVISRLNDGVVTKHELDKKEALLDTFQQREVEILVCLNLYKTSNTKYAQERYLELSRKLYKLREIRSAVHAKTDGKTLTTKNTERDKKQADEFAQSLMAIKLNKEREEYEQRAWRELNDHLYAENGNPNVKKQDFNSLITGRSLQIDKDTERLRTILLYEIMKNGRDSYAEEVVASRYQNYTKNDLVRNIDRLRQLRGIKTEEEKTQEREEKIRKIKERMLHARFEQDVYKTFDTENYNMLLQEQREREVG